MQTSTFPHSQYAVRDPHGFYSLPTKSKLRSQFKHPINGITLIELEAVAVKIKFTEVSTGVQILRFLPLIDKSNRIIATFVRQVCAPKPCT